MSENGDNNDIKKQRGPYKRIEKLHIIHEIERLLTAGYNASYIQQQLKLSERTYDRYRQKAFKDEKETMLGLSVDFAMERIAECDRRFRELQNHAISISQNRSVDGDTRVAAISTAAEIEKQRLILVSSGPEIVSRLKAYPKTVERLVAVIASRNHLQLPQSQPQLKQPQPQLQQHDKGK